MRLRKRTIIGKNKLILLKMSKNISLKQFLMRSGRFERSYDCIAAIKDGKVTIDDEIITRPNHFFNHKKLLVRLYGEKVKPLSKLYFLFNKPSGYLCQKSASEKTVYDLLTKLNLPKESKQSLYTVGRLDKDTEGLLIMTNDGRLSNAITNPKNEIVKKYYAVLEKQIDREKIKILEKGIEISIGRERYKTKSCKIEIVGEKNAYISISEGRKRQIKKMFDAIGNKVVYLRRVSIGNIQLEKLKIGEFKEISREEIYKKMDISNLFKQQ